MYKLFLTPNREDRERFAVLVSYEVGPMQDFGATLVPVRREWRWLRVDDGWKWTCVRVTQLRRVPGLRTREWVRHIDREAPETEDLRRERILQVRETTNLTSPYAMPDWDAALALREKANHAAEFAKVAGSAAFVGAAPRAGARSQASRSAT